MTTVETTANLTASFAGEVGTRLDRIAALAADGGLDEAITLLTEAIQAGAVIQAFGTGHSEAFAMEIAGRAGGLIPTTKIALRDLVLRGGYEVATMGGSAMERNPNVAEDLWAVSTINPGDVFVIASNSGVNGSIVGMALLAKQHGHPVIAVTSLEHTMAVSPKHPSGQRLCDVADVVIDNLAPYGDATLELASPVGAEPVEAADSGPSTGSGHIPAEAADSGPSTSSGHIPAEAANSGPSTSSGHRPTSSGPRPTSSGHTSVPVGSVSSITSAFIAQLLTIGVAERIAATGAVPPLYLSANIPGGDEHNSVLEAKYEGRIRRGT